VALSSAFGLALRGVSEGQDLDWARNIIVNVWSRSADADVVFTIGTIVAGLLSYRLAERRLVGASIVAGFVLNWIVYWLSFLLLATPGNPNAQLSRDLAESLRFVAQWGILGLIFSAIAPVVAQSVLAGPAKSATERRMA
jgi:hypothetical protein